MTTQHHIPARATGPQTSSFGVHRQSDRPASAIRAGASTMPKAWQTRGIANRDGRYEHGAPVRSFADMVLDPLRWVTASKTHLVVSVLGAGVALSILWF